MVRALPSAALADAQLPDFGQVTIIPAAGIIGYIVVGVHALATGRSREEAEAAAFYGLIIGGSGGILAYLVLLLLGVL